MPPKTTNRFELFADPDDEEPTGVVQSPPKDNPFVNQVAGVDTPWEEVKHNGATRKPVTTLRIRNTPSHLPHSMQTRNISAGNPSPELGSSSNHKENWCGICKIQFSSKAMIQAHVKAQSTTHANYCNLCKRVFVDRNGLRNHVENAQGHEVFCNLCLSAFLNNWALQNHFENNYSAGHQFVCLACLLGFNTNVELEKHLRTGEKHVWCTTCHRKFPNQTERDAHWRATTKHKHCLQTACDFDAPNAAALEKHLVEDHFHCEGCKRIFPSRTRLTNHQNECQSGIACKNCGALCAGHSQLAEHMATCFRCTECGFNTDGADKLQLHISNHEAATAAFSCWGCTAFHANSHIELIQHIETCPSLPPRTFLSVLGKWWYSPLYMDLDVHAQIRRQEIDLDTMASWMREGVLLPFICRAETCNRVAFSKLSDLFEHVQGDGCKWDEDRLRLDTLKKEFERAGKGKSGDAA